MDWFSFFIGVLATIFVGVAIYAIAWLFGGGDTG
jgi:hypothetical protein